jgi:glycosyltransferase involved in cell wall biosynthesis
MRTHFTIAIPTHDRRETTLLAARSALAQTRAPEQLLVLCDGCSDGTAEALRELGDPRVEALELPKGPGFGYEHRNRSLELARSEAILWLSDDDLLAPDHLERIGELWDTGRFDLVQSHGVLVLADDQLGWLGADWSVPFLRERLALFNTNPMSAVSIRVDTARAVGGWDPSLPRAADWDLWQRALAAGARSAISPEPTVLHFRAAERDQDWAGRVGQNAAWLARMEDPESLLAMRICLRRVGAERNADVDAHAEELQRALDATRAELAAAQKNAAANAAEAKALGTTLARIYDGGWWRLRRHVLPLMRLLGRGG